ncbi:MAG: DUF2934 domain-containing protein [Pseudomonadota bacterium]
METTTSTRYKTNTKTTYPRSTKTTSTNLLTSDQRERLIRELAYSLAERDNFCGNPTEYWLEAERRVDARL